MSDFRIGTRGSALATTQTGIVARALSAAGAGDPETLIVKTEGDVVTGSLAALGGTGVFAASLRQRVLDGGVEVAVHSLKDLPVAQPEGLSIAAIPTREDVRDVLVARDGHTLDNLPTGSVVGTGSPRRAAQLLAARPDLRVADIRGNVPTRLRRVKGLVLEHDDPGSVGRERAGDLDAVILAGAGLDRLGLQRFVTERIDPHVMLPAPGQGALAVEVSSATAAADSPLTRALLVLDDAATRWAVSAERALLARLEGGCAAPLGALAVLSRTGSLRVDAVAVSPDGSRSLRRHASAQVQDLAGALALGERLADELLAAGAAQLMGTNPEGEKP
ncbi:hydroxymethylbilane synthase [Galactobacter caseinivorans]|uniref:Hydroxymethylbilane synthase n=1 Tax=Galactobacter caseinivorans TaxID=2676123 RepID=A0A496PM44_9MICC|nr:hydroxymethylbilane synthase [Galactobacter caseinivorans]RKW71610.1 hydroxymethylbilane synthase [Galactobacter caseinivorans]